MTAYYNEIDPKAAAWLRELISRKLIANGVVDERSIIDVNPTELARFSQCHFFAGIGGWSLALRQAGWADDCPVWTGSCPCQPFSIAGNGKAENDERHLWPEFYRQIQKQKPYTIFGEQVSSPDALRWWDLVASDLEREGYACGATIAPASGFGAFHRRERLYWMANTHGRQELSTNSSSRTQRNRSPEWCGNSEGEGRRLLANPNGGRRQSWLQGSGGEFEKQESTPQYSPVGQTQWVKCLDGKSRPIESGIYPLVDALPERVALLRGYGNAIFVPQAIAFIQAAMQIIRQ